MSIVWRNLATQLKYNVTIEESNNALRHDILIAKTRDGGGSIVTNLCEG